MSLTTFKPSRIDQEERTARRKELRKRLDEVAEKREELKRLEGARSRLVAEHDQASGKLADLDKQRADLLVRGETVDANLDKASEKVQRDIGGNERARKILSEQIGELRDAVKAGVQMKLEYKKLADPKLLDRQWWLSWAIPRADAQLREAQGRIGQYRAGSKDKKKYDDDTRATYAERLRRWEYAADRVSAELSALREESAELERQILE